MNNIDGQYHQWIENVLSSNLPSNINGIAINLYEGPDSFDAELIATPEFDAENEDWACNDIFMSDRFEFPHKDIGHNWEIALNKIVQSTKDYIANNTKGAQFLSTVKGVGVGFVDGNLVMVQVNT